MECVFWLRRFQSSTHRNVATRRKRMFAAPDWLDTTNKWMSMHVGICAAAERCNAYFFIQGHAQRRDENHLVTSERVCVNRHRWEERLVAEMIEQIRWVRMCLCVCASESGTGTQWGCHRTSWTKELSIKRFRRATIYKIFPRKQKYNIEKWTYRADDITHTVSLTATFQAAEHHSVRFIRHYAPNTHTLPRPSSIRFDGALVFNTLNVRYEPLRHRHQWHRLLNRSTVFIVFLLCVHSTSAIAPPK